MLDCRIEQGTEAAPKRVFYRHFCGIEICGQYRDHGQADLVLSERMQTSLNYASNWCKEANLSINIKKA
jgi:hypothetical protein